MDRKRAAAGLEKYRAGSLYNPRNALELMELASFFQPDLQRVVRHLTPSEAERFHARQTLLNAAAKKNSKKII